MAEVTVSQFAEVLKVPVDRLLVQLDQAGIKVNGPDDRISDDAKLELLTHLRRSHGAGAESERDAAPRRITLKRKTQSELKLASAQGRARTVSVEVRQKRTYIKRDVLEEQARQQQDEIDHKRHDAEESARRESERIEAERRESERLEAENRRRIEEEETARRRAQDEARRLVEERAREEEEHRAREEQQRQAQERHAQERRVAPAAKAEPAQALRAPAAPPAAAAPRSAAGSAGAPGSAARERAAPATAAPGRGPATDDRHTRYGRQELHVTSDVSSRYKKKRRIKSRAMPSGAADGRHG
ncbi:MAG TPA: translation initiation factor IF-2 associated domain-containing protein, partial [Steroidobacteraceae bacterium]|nr:translation initiation factor IF-2 associated domain-containing protein [Steroidobacteraceae bacterium]